MIETLNSAPPPSVSVVVPLYNRTHTIQFCIDSIFNQTFQDFEVIVIDDGSSDNSYELCNKLYGNRKNFYIFKHPYNMGQACALNSGIKFAKGKYVAILHSDDMFMNNHLEVLYKTAESTGADVVHTIGFFREHSNSGDTINLKPFIMDKSPVQQLTIIPEDNVQRLAEWMEGTHIDAFLNLFRREFLLTYNINFESISAENNLFCFQWIMNAKVYVKIPDITYFYRPVSDSISLADKKPDFISEIIKNMIQGINCLDQYMSNIDIFQKHEALQDLVKSHFVELVDAYWINRLRIYDTSGNMRADFKNIFNIIMTQYFGQNTWIVKHYFHKYHKILQEHKNLNKLFSVQNSQIKKLASHIKKHKAYIDGYFALNVGDDLFFNILFSRYPNIIFFIPAKYSYPEMFKIYPNVICESQRTMTTIEENMKNIDNYDILISIGGSLFQSRLIEYVHGKYKLFIDKFIKNDKPIFIMGSNFDRSYKGVKYTEKDFYAMFKAAGDKLNISLRDTYSYGYFRDLPNVRYVPDIIFGIKDEFSPKVNLRVGLGISIISTKKDYRKSFHEQYLHSIVSIVKSSIKRNIDVTFFSFCTKEGDEDMVNEIMLQLNAEEKSKVKHLAYDGDLTTFLKTFASMKYIVASRFHANVLALKFRQSLFPIVYDDKTLNLLEDLDLLSKNDFYDLRQNKSLNIKRVWNVLDNPKDFNEKIKNWEIMATQHFLKLDEYLKME